jgi:hypothetical protein
MGLGMNDGESVLPVSTGVVVGDTPARSSPFVSMGICCLQIRRLSPRIPPAPSAGSATSRLPSGGPCRPGTRATQITAAAGTSWHPWPDWVALLREAGELGDLDGGGHGSVCVHRVMCQQALLAEGTVGAVDDDGFGVGGGGVPGVRVLAVRLGQVAGEAGLAGIIGNEGDRAGRSDGRVYSAVVQDRGVPPPTVRSSAFPAHRNRG